MDTKVCVQYGHRSLCSIRTHKFVSPIVALCFCDLHTEHRFLCRGLWPPTGTVDYGGWTIWSKPGEMPLLAIAIVRIASNSPPKDHQQPPTPTIWINRNSWCAITAAASSASLTVSHHRQFADANRLPATAGLPPLTVCGYHQFADAH